MKCAICGLAEMRPGTTTLALDRGSSTVVLRHVPADICLNCGEEYVSELTSRRVLHVAEKALGSSGTVEVREFADG